MREEDEEPATDPWIPVLKQNITLLLKKIIQKKTIYVDWNQMTDRLIPYLVPEPVAGVAPICPELAEADRFKAISWPARGRPKHHYFQFFILIVLIKEKQHMSYYNYEHIRKKI